MSGSAPAPTALEDRIETLDVLRGFALLGILLLNIIGFGMLSTAYMDPLAVPQSTVDLTVWASVDILAEGAMRALFSILFGAGVVLFASNKAAGLYYRRTFWLLLFGLFDAFILLWSGDILVSYALVGAVLYWFRNTSAAALIGGALALMATLGVLYAVSGHGLEQLKLNSSAEWQAFLSDFQLTGAQAAEELTARNGSYASAFAWNAEATLGMLTFVLPVIMFWDALAFMLLGMGLYKAGVLQGERPERFYVRLALAGFFVGLAVNGFEATQAYCSGFAFLETFPYAQPSYHLGRLGMALGYLSMLVIIVQRGLLAGLRGRLACVGRMALTNYLMHSLICLLLFTGAGFGLAGRLDRSDLYLVVVGIWVVQLLYSPWWLARFRFGPAEWLWRGLTYGRFPRQRNDISV